MKKITFCLVLILTVFFPRPAHAYLDPGTGSYILQILGAAIFGSLFALKIWWRQITGFFSNLFKKKK